MNKQTIIKVPSCDEGRDGSKEWVVFHLLTRARGYAVMCRWVNGCKVYWIRQWTYTSGKGHLQHDYIVDGPDDTLDECRQQIAFLIEHYS